MDDKLEERIIQLENASEEIRQQIAEFKQMIHAASAPFWISKKTAERIKAEDLKTK